MKADPAAQEILLKVQELDSRLDGLRHQARTPPEAEELARLAESTATLRSEAGDLQIRVDDLTRAQRRADDDVEQVKARKARDQQRLDSGAVTNPRDLEHLQHELVALDRRVAELEDAELEVMEELEEAQQRLDALRAELARATARTDELNATREQRLGELRSEAAQVVESRKGVAAKLPDPLLALYERLRTQKDGVGAALLRERRCGGCRLELNSSDLATLAGLPADEVARCEECGRILVRTAESGL